MKKSLQVITMIKSNFINTLKALSMAASFWGTWFVGYHTIQPHPFANWWGFPTMVSLLAFNLVMVGLLKPK